MDRKHQVNQPERTTIEKLPKERNGASTGSRFSRTEKQTSKNQPQNVVGADKEAKQQPRGHIVFLQPRLRLDYSKCGHGRLRRGVRLRRN